VVARAGRQHGVESAGQLDRAAAEARASHAVHPRRRQQHRPRRVHPHARQRQGVARGRDRRGPDRAADRRAPRRSRRLLRALDRRDDQSRDGARDGVPADLPARAGQRPAALDARADRDQPRAPSRRVRGGGDDRDLHLLLSLAARPRADADAAQRGVRRSRADDRRRARAHPRAAPDAAPRADAARVGGGRRRHEHPARGRVELHRRRRAALDADVGLDARDDVGDDLLAAPVRRVGVHAVADGRADGRDHARGPVPEPGGGGGAARVGAARSRRRRRPSFTRTANISAITRSTVRIICSGSTVRRSSNGPTTSGTSRAATSASRGPVRGCRRSSS
jgi:hypothetical protein